MAQAKRTLKKFNFESEGASVALVGASQGGPANGVTTLVTKATDTSETPEVNIKKSFEGDVTVEMSIMEFLERYLGLWWDDAEIIASLLGFSAEEINSYWASDLDATTSYLDSRLEKITINKSATAQQFLAKFEEFKSTTDLVKKALGVKPKETQETTLTEKGVKSMPQANDNVSQAFVQEQIAKALAEKESTIKAEVEAVYKQREEKLSAELAVLKSFEDQRQAAIFKAQAESIKEVLGDTVEVEALAKALRSANENEDTKSLVALVKSLVATTKTDETLVEKGATPAATPEDNSEDSKVEAIAKSLLDADPTMPSYTAYCKAYEQVYSTQQ